MEAQSAEFIVGVRKMTREINLNRCLAKKTRLLNLRESTNGTENAIPEKVQ